MAVQIAKTNLAVTSRPTAGPIIAKTNLAVASEPGGEVASDYPAYRYTRLLIANRNDSNNWAGFGEIELVTTPGGIDRTSPADAAVRATASVNPVGTEGHQAFDDVLTKGAAGDYHFWQTSGGNGFNEWVKWDWGAGQEKAVREVRLYPNPDGLARTPRHIIAQGSNDDIEWTTEFIIIIPAWTAFEWKNCVRPDFDNGLANLWAVITTAPEVAGSLSCDYLAFEDSATVSINDGPAISSSVNGANVAANADALGGGYWLSSAIELNMAYLGRNFPVPVRPSFARWRARNDASFGQSPASGFVARSKDQLVWVPEAQFSGFTWAAGASNFVEIPEYVDPGGEEPRRRFTLIC